ncbi:hypothetical protein [Spirosoma foliorum]|uniref:Uncharacterized protein n=1 Tax=Spirosoma foliorum TaxID=2710596 RepID=A0A7G5H2G4_9BACT|nr:hypothetical protein [Spirosoma foliorum]QMW05306.1 hypothetical protein H3H32_10675 [Spirosoma foliorum]
MTTQQLRSIASYWGTYTASYIDSHQKSHHRLLVDADVMRDLEETMVRSFKLHLRRIDSLTDEEVETLMQLTEQHNPEFQFNGDTRIDRSAEDCIYIGMDGKLILYFNGEIAIDRHYSGITAPLYAYLQSIAVYVPGTIEEEFVEFV